MMVTNWFRVAGLGLSATLLLIFAAGHASAQGRGMMMPMQSMMMNSSMSMPNQRVATLLMLLRQRDAALAQALNQVQAEINALARNRPTAMRNADIMALQRQEALLMLAIRQTAAQIASLGG